MKRLPKSLRIPKLLDLLGSNRHYLTARELAKTLNITERTFYRDIDSLSRLGHPVYRDRGYKLLKILPRQKAALTQEDLQTLRVLADTSPIAKVPEIKQRCLVLLSKLEDLLPFEANDPDDSVISTGDGLSPDQLLFSLNKLETALTKRLECVVFYQGLRDDEPVERTTQPYALTIRAGNWYLIAYDIDRNAYRTFRLERIFKLTLSKKLFKRDEKFDLGEYFANSWGVFRGKPTQVKIRLYGIAARIASERNWPKDRKLKWEDDHTAILTATVEGTEEILAWVMSLGANAEVLAPKALKDHIIKNLTLTLKTYEK